MKRPRPSNLCSQWTHSLYAGTPEGVDKVLHEVEYYTFVASLQSTFSAMAPEEPMLQVSTNGLYEIYLETVPGRRCRSCSKFFSEYGGAVRVDGITGRVTSALWNGRHIPAEYAKAAEALCTLCESRPVVGVFSTYATHLCDRSFEAERGHMHVFGNRRLEPTEGLHAAFDVVRGAVEFHSLATTTKALCVLRKLGGERVAPMLTKLTWLAAYLRRAANIRDADRRMNLLWYDMASVSEELFHEGHSALHMLPINLTGGLSTRSALAALSHDLDRSPRQWP